MQHAYVRNARNLWPQRYQQPSAIYLPLDVMNYNENGCKGTNGSNYIYKESNLNIYMIDSTFFFQFAYELNLLFWKNVPFLLSNVTRSYFEVNHLTKSMTRLEVF